VGKNKFHHFWPLLEKFWKNPQMASPAKRFPTTMNTAFGIGFGNNNYAKHFLRGIKLCTFDHINDGNCFKPKEIFKNTQRKLFRIFSSQTITQFL